MGVVLQICVSVVVWFLANQGYAVDLPGANLCGPHLQCVPSSQCSWGNVDSLRKSSCEHKHPDHVCCPNSKVINGGSYGSSGASSHNYGGNGRYGSSSRYGNLNDRHRFGANRYSSDYQNSDDHGYDRYSTSHSGSDRYSGFGPTRYGGIGSDRYGGSGSSRYGGSGSNRYGGTSKYSSGRHDPYYMDFYHDLYEKYFGYSLSKQAKELLRNYRPREECGVRNKSPADMARIATGYLHDYGFTSFGEFPWHVALLIEQRRFGGYGHDKAYRYHCGATLIHKSLLITAAHCVRGVHPRKLLAHLGDWNLQDSTGELFPAIKRKISRVFIHSGYNPGTYLNDIALLEMNEAVDTFKTPHISPICLPKVNYELKDHSKCFIVGWGDDVYKPNFGSNILKSVSVTYASDKECSNRLYATLKHVDDDFILDTDSQKCILGAYGKDACVGDGGGGVFCPLGNDEGPDVCNTANCANEHYFLFGVISFGSPVCGEESVTIITDLVQNLNWVYTLLEPAGGLKNYDHKYYKYSGRTAEESGGLNSTNI